MEHYAVLFILACSSSFRVELVTFCILYSQELTTKIGLNIQELCPTHSTIHEFGQDNNRFDDFFDFSSRPFRGCSWPKQTSRNEEAVCLDQSCNWRCEDPTLS